MPKEIGRYDSEMQQFVENPKVKMKTLLFNRWLAENGRFSYYPFSSPTGEYALALSIETKLPIAQAVDGAFNYSMQESLRRRMAATGDY